MNKNIFKSYHLLINGGAAFMQETSMWLSTFREKKAKPQRLLAMLQWDLLLS